MPFVLIVYQFWKGTFKPFLHCKIIPFICHFLYASARTLRPGKSQEVHQQIVLQRNRVIYIGEYLLFGRVNLVLGYGLFGIFNQQSSHNIRKCFHILWLDKLHSMQSLWLSLWKIVRRLGKSSPALLVGLVSECSVQI